MGTITGEVAFINVRDVKSKKTGKTYKAYGLKLRTANGDVSLDCGFEKPEVEQGDYIEAVTETSARGYEDLKSFKSVPKPSAAARAAVSVQADSGTDQADRQTQIVLQHSQEMAIAEVDLLLRNNALPVSAATGKGGMAKRYEEIHAAVQKLTVELYFDVVTARLLDTVADAGDLDLSADAALPSAAQSDSTATGGDE